MARSPKKLGRPALSIENRENQLASLAFDLVEQRLRDGTATSQETTYFLKLMSTKTRHENEIMALNKELVKAKTEALQSQKKTEEMFVEAMAAFRKYSGNGDSNEEY